MDNNRKVNIIILIITLTSEISIASCSREKITVNWKDTSTVATSSVGNLYSTAVYQILSDHKTVFGPNQKQNFESEYTEILNDLTETYGIDENITLMEMQVAFQNYFKEVDPSLVNNRDYLVSMAESMRKNEVPIGKLTRENSEAAKAFLYLNLSESDSINIFSYSKETKLKDLLYFHFQNIQDRN